MDRTECGRGIDRDGGSVVTPKWGSHSIDHHCPMAPSVFWGLGSPLAGQAGPSLAVGSQDLSGVEENKGLPYPGLLHRCVKVQRGSIWRDQPGRGHASLGEVWEGCAPGLGVTREREKGEPQPPDQILACLDLGPLRLSPHETGLP